MPLLGRVVLTLNGLYTQYLNRKRGIDGTLCRGRYKSIVVEDDVYLLQVSRYIHLNPVGSGVVDDPVAYAASSCRDYVYAQPRFIALETDYLLAMIGRASPAARRRRYRRFLNEGLDDTTHAFYARQRQWSIFGSEGFRERRSPGTSG